MELSTQKFIGQTSFTPPPSESKRRTSSRLESRPAYSKQQLPAEPAQPREQRPIFAGAGQVTAFFHRFGVDEAQKDCRVLDVSARGARVRTPHRVAEGERIVIKINVDHFLFALPIIAQVTYSFAHQGEWVLGCLFVETGAENESVIGSTSGVLHPSSGGRRRFGRYFCNFQSSCRSMIACSLNDWTASVVNVSQGGVCLANARRMELGSVLRIEMGSMDSAMSKTLVGKVVHLQASQIGSFEIGCSFATEIPQDELEALLNLDANVQSQ